MVQIVADLAVVAFNLLTYFSGDKAEKSAIKMKYKQLGVNPCLVLVALLASPLRVSMLVLIIVMPFCILIGLGLV